MHVGHRQRRLKSNISCLLRAITVLKREERTCVLSSLTGCVFVRLLGKTLEHEFQAELDIAVIRDGIGNVSEGTGSRETGDGAVGIIELWPVERVEKLGAELKFQLLANGEILEE